MRSPFKFVVPNFRMQGYMASELMLVARMRMMLMTVLNDPFCFRVSPFAARNAMATGVPTTNSPSAGRKLLSKYVPLSST